MDQVEERVADGANAAVTHSERAELRAEVHCFASTWIAMMRMTPTVRPPTRSSGFTTSLRLSFGGILFLQSRGLRGYGAGHPSLR